MNDRFCKSMGGGMSIRWRESFKLLLVGLFIFLQSLHAAAAEWNPVIEGRWEVESVHLNVDAEWTPSYGWNDPRLVGRLFIFNKNRIWTDAPENRPCVEINSKTSQTNLRDLISTSMSGFGNPATNATEKNYKIDIPGSTMVDVVRVFCGSQPWQGSLGASDKASGAWMLSPSPGKLLLRWYGETILTLKRVRDNEKPNPSFNCAKAKSEVEMEICSSYELSSFDKSIATSFSQLIEQRKSAGDAVGDVIRKQREWISKRNLCGKDAACILDAMKVQLLQLDGMSRN
ncbi:lysozyme inhibitor LprI family protein [Burkholderia sp. AU16741]|uniref:lysozyme inhibitor LprI family protein n=1 Tax=Burkholderia sp. AU16741 TaxID=2015347 RepID=UPI00117FD96A|nr:lysozyme inhibitor LprI family protein [Burkholderia sp. AU16741]